MHPARAELATLKGKRKRNLGKKLRKRLKMAKGAAIKEPKKEGKAEAAERKRGQTTTALAASRGPRAEVQMTRGGVTEAHLQLQRRPREGSVPNSKSWNIPEVIIVRRGAGRVLGIWGGWVNWVKGGASGVSLQAT